LGTESHQVVVAVNEIKMYVIGYLCHFIHFIKSERDDYACTVCCAKQHPYSLYSWPYLTVFSDSFVFIYFLETTQP